MVSISSWKATNQLSCFLLLIVRANVVLKRVLDFHEGFLFFHLLSLVQSHRSLPYLSSAPKVLSCYGQAIMHGLDKGC